LRKRPCLPTGKTPLPAVSDLQTHTGYLLRMASNAVSHEFARRIAVADVTVAEWAMMRMLYDVNAVSPSALAGAMGMTKGAISKLADRLLSKGLIDRHHNVDDKGAHALSLTASGRSKVPALAAIADGNDEDFFAVLSDDERTALRALLHMLIDRRKLTGTPVD
jgi:DNA-binding MarR family transcriptional regulator